ncbi:YLP motif-containing protein 1, partial [Glycine soja]
SGKSYLAKILHDLEVENGGDAPRIHSMDDYFMTEVGKVEDGEASKSSSSSGNKKPVTKKVMKFCYEPEMEENSCTTFVLSMQFLCLEMTCGRAGERGHYVINCA